MQPKTLSGLPIITVKSIEKVLQEHKILPWQRIAEPIPLDQYKSGALSEEEKSELRFAPHVEVIKLLTPNQKIFHGFRTTAKHGTVTFVLLPGDYVPVVAEFRHGVERVLLNLPGGLLDDENPIRGAKREFEEETGIKLESIEQINKVGVPIIGRSTTATNFSFLGIPRKPIVAKTRKLDREEFLGTFVVRLPDWLTLATLGLVDSHSVVTTLLALKYLKKI